MESGRLISSSTESINLQSFDLNKKFSFYSNKTRTVLQNDVLYSLSDLESFANLIKDNLFWLDVKSPSKSDLKTLSEMFNIHPLTIDDILSNEGREKTEGFDNYVFLCVKVCDIDLLKAKGNDFSNSSLMQEKMFILLYPSFIITIHNTPDRQFRNVIKRMDPIKNSLTFTSDWFVYALLDDIVDEFMPGLKQIEYEVESIDEAVLYFKRLEQKEMLRRIGLARNQVNQSLRLLRPKIDVINALIKRHGHNLRDHTLLYIRDTQDHIMSKIQNLDQNSESLNRAHNNYLAQISIELAEMSNRMNLQVKILTQVTALALPFAVVSGLWGMNVIVPFELVNGSMATLDMLYPFFFMFLLSVVFSIGFWFLGRRMNFF